MIRFLNTREYNAAEIYHQLCETYGPTAMSDGKVRQWCHVFSGGCSNVHNEESSGRPSTRIDDLAECVNEKIIALRLVIFP